MVSNAPWFNAATKVFTASFLSYAMYKVVESSQKDVPGARTPKENKYYDQTRATREVITGGGPASLGQLREQTAEKRRQLAEKYAEEEFQRNLEKQRKENEAAQRKK